MKKILIGIHGLDNKPPKNILADWWVQSIREGLEKSGKAPKDIPFELVYWADIIHPVPLDPASTDAKDPQFVEDPYVKSLAKVADHKSSFKANAYRYIDEQLNRIFLNDDLSINFKRVSDQIIQRYFSDLARYLNDGCPSLTSPNCSARVDMRKRVATTLKKFQGYDILLIAHSMGSIIAFDVLFELSDSLDIDTFITIGSPLGIPVMVGRVFARQKQIYPASVKPRTPDCIWPNWLNMADPEDKVALDISLNDDYVANRLGTSPIDITVHNDYEINGHRNPHKSYGYLRTPEMAQVIGEFLSRSYLARTSRRFVKFTKTAKANFRSMF